jgi:hypothetical protein
MGEVTSTKHWAMEEVKKLLYAGAIQAYIYIYISIYIACKALQYPCGLHNGKGVYIYIYI